MNARCKNNVKIYRSVKYLKTSCYNQNGMETQDFENVSFNSAYYLYKIKHYILTMDTYVQKKSRFLRMV